jgi:hypothetical protein
MKRHHLGMSSQVMLMSWFSGTWMQSRPANGCTRNCIVSTVGPEPPAVQQDTRYSRRGRLVRKQADPW